ncbi:MAG TPA: hypothetical protein DD723_05855 [Candidatus Omnitrophica bacterium]|nr:MAG: hypothetical protein A2Z81_06920 [Omnitrophica WOR_2 bacterium GWA2_45_18]OGX18319.1 MAG: hypothetical protein A2Y04_03640 [Omnitrophica WOR_2 bacterium GWC2_45_7]HBR15050.1 hypothetical protein [Candidatus Omnitrophota bacterium]
MKQKYFISIGFVVLIGVIIVLVFRVTSLQKETADNNQKLSARIANFESSINSLNKTIDSLKEQVPGLGEYMTTIQLHMAKLWFAGQAKNWDLAKFEVHEIEETMEVVANLNITRKDVNISSVIQSVLNSQIPDLEKAIQEKSLVKFETAYEQTVITCNSCHNAVGHQFIHVIKPTSPPVTNQKWEPVLPDQETD